MSSTWWHKLMRKTRTRPITHTPKRSLQLEWLEDRTTPAGLFAVASDPGTITAVAGFDAATRVQKFSVIPYPGFTGGANLAIGDVNGDGTPDVVTGPKLGGGPTVNVYSGIDGTLLKSFTAGDPNSRAGVSVAVADYTGDGLCEIVVGTLQNGQPLVQVLRFADLSVVHSYTPFTGTNGVSVAAGDVNGDGVPDTIIGAGPGGAPRVMVFSGANNSVLMNLFTFETTFTGGITVAAADLNGDSRADVITAANFLGGPRIQAFNGLTQQVLVNFFAYGSELRAGVTASPMDTAGNGQVNLVTANGTGQPTEIKAFDGRTTAAVAAPTVGGLPITSAWDTVAPLPALTTTSPNTTNVSPIPVQATFPEPVNGFSAAGIAVTNGTVSNFVKTDAKNYTFDVTPSSDGLVSITVIAGAATDAAGNASVASPALTRTFDATPPTVTANPIITNDQTPNLSGTVSDAAATVSVTVQGQTFAATVTGNTWAATVPSLLAEGTYDIVVTATDAAGNTATATATNGLIIDLTPPSVAITSSAPDPTSTTPIPVTVTFSEDVTGFDIFDVLVSNGTATNFVAVNAQQYTFDVIPTSQTVVSVSIGSGVAFDAAGNGNTIATALTRTFSTGTIALTANTRTTNDPTPTLTGTVSDPSATVEVTVNGEVVTATVTGNDWSATLTSPLAEGTYDIQVAATNTASETGSLTVSGGLVIDLTAPTVTLEPPATDPTNLDVIAFTATFSEPVTGLTAAGITVNNGTVVNIVPTGALSFKIEVGPAADGLVEVTVNADAAIDAAGNGNLVSTTASVTSDRSGPTVTITSSATDPTTVQPIPFTITFSKDAIGFAASDVGVTNGTILSFTATTPQSYAIEVVPNGAGDVVVSVAAGVATDSLGNPNTAAAPFTIEFTGTVTTAAITTSAVSPSALLEIPYTITFSDDVIGFDENDITVVNGTVTDFVPSDTRTFTFTVRPTLDGVVTISVAAGAATDSNGDPTAAATASITSDRTPPAVAITPDAGSVSNTSPLTFTVTFSEDVIGFDEADVDVDNGTLVDVTPVDARTYTVTVTPTANGDVTVSVLAGAAQDAAGNSSLAPAPARTTFDTVAPTGTITAASPTSTSPIPFTIAFSEDVLDLVLGDLEVVNGTAQNLVRVGPRRFELEVVPTSDGPVTLRVLAGATTDVAGNANAAFEHTISFDGTAPTGTIDTDATAALTGTADDGTGSGMLLVEVAVRNGVAGQYWDWNAATPDFTSDVPVFVSATDTGGGDPWATWTIDFPAEPGTYLAEARLTDLANNQVIISGTIEIS